MMSTSIPKNFQERFVAIHTQRWTNIGLAIVFLCTALFVYAFINTGLPNWWNNITDSLIVSLILEVFLFIPIAFLLLMCIIANEHYNSVSIRVCLLICFSFLTSILLVFIICSGSDISKLWPTYSIGVFLFYTLIIMFVLFTFDIFVMPVMNMSAGLHFVPCFKTILSIPLVYVVWHVTKVGWVWLIIPQVWIFFFFYNAKTCFTWEKIKKLYLGDFDYRCSFIKINMFKIDNYKKLGLYLSVYNFLPNIFNVINESVNNIDSVNETLEEQMKKKENNILDVLYQDNLNNDFGNKLKYDGKEFVRCTPAILPQNKFDKQHAIGRLIAAFTFYISFGVILYCLGNLFIS